jgi:hypothetical protein
MGDFWRLKDDDQTENPLAAPMPQPTGGAVRKEQITIRLDPGMIADARLIAARKGIGHHTLLRMWVMEGITRAYQEGLLEGPPRSWSPPGRRATADAGEHPVQERPAARPAESSPA